MDYINNVLEALGRALSEKDSQIYMLKIERDGLKEKLAKFESSNFSGCAEIVGSCESRA